MPFDRDLDDDLLDLPPTAFEEAQRRNRAELARNELREKRRIRRDNQAKGFDAPRPGTKLYVQLDGSVSRQRTRAGLRFERGRRVEVTVSDRPDDEIAAAQRAGQLVVTPFGAEQIIEDTALHVYASPDIELDVSDLQARNAAAEEELRLARREADSLREQLRAARMSAQDTGDGKPNRLIAQAQAKAKAGGQPAPTPATPEFGATEPPEPKK